jgi:YHS domain-containing protein
MSVASDRMRLDQRISEPLKMRLWVERGTPKLNLDSNGVILKGYDVVAYFTQNKAIKRSPAYHKTYQGATYYFSSVGDSTTFKKNPSRYVPRYSGFCANGVLNNRLGDTDPTVFFIEKGKLYVCASAQEKRQFQVHSLEHVIKAQRNWYQMFE